MFVRLFYTLRKYGVPVSTRELIDLNEAVASGLVFANQDEFYQLAKTVMVKDERFFDKFDRAMKDYFDGISTFDLDDLLNQVHKLPKDWFDLELLEKHLTPEQREELKKAGSLEELMKMLEERLREQHKKHQGGNKMMVPVAHRPLVPMVIILKVCGLVDRDVNAPPLKSGNSANTKTSMTNRFWVQGKCRWLSAVYASLPVRVQLKSWILTARFVKPPSRAFWMCSWCRSVATVLKC